MTTRAIKKLVKKDDLKDLELKLNQNLESEESEEENFIPRNKFDLLEQQDFDQIEENQSDEESSNLERKEQTTKISKKKKKKLKDKRANDFKFVSTNIEEENTTLEELSNLNLTSQSSKSPYENDNVRRLFKIESKYLNSDNEMIKMFGAKIVQADRNVQNPRTGRRLMNRFKNNAIVNMKQSWPQFTKEGLSMKILKECDSNNKVIEFTFEHSKEYQQVQFRFLDAVESLDHNNIMFILQFNRYHIDSLIQLSDISRIHDDTQMAADLIERALFAFQNSFHSSFKFTSNPNMSNAQIYKIDYNRVENRGFFICLFKQILYVGGRACYRTSLELCKLLLSLDLQGDPLGVILLIDFYAIRSSQYEYLIEFYETFRDLKHLNLMPNMLMSYALAHHYLYNKTHNKDNLEKGNKALTEALLRFPGVLMTMLDKFSVMPEKKVESHKFFAKTSHLKMPEGLKYLINLYVTRMHHEWKISENLYWLEQTVKSIIENEEKHENFFNQCKNKTNSLFSKVPPNLYRHLILSDLKEVAVHLPTEYSSTASYTFDPIPPKNSIISYTRPQRSEHTQSTATSSESLFTFFQSLLPTFNAQNLNRPPRNLQENNAVGLEDNRGFDINQMVERLREFLANIEQNFPATRQNDFEENQNEEGEFD